MKVMNGLRIINQVLDFEAFYLLLLYYFWIFSAFVIQVRRIVEKRDGFLETAMTDQLWFLDVLVFLILGSCNISWRQLLIVICYICHVCVKVHQQSR